MFSYNSVRFKLDLMLLLVLHCEAVRFSQFSEGLNVVEHDRVKMECNVIGKLDTDEVTWKSTENTHRHTIIGKGDKKLYTVSLIIESADRSDKGEYVCEIKSKGDIQTQTLVLTILEIPKETYPVCGELPTATEDLQVTLTCNSENVDPAPMIKWYKKDKYNGSLYEIETDKTKIVNQMIQLKLTFTPTAANNKDIYVCKLSTQANAEWSRECRRILHVRYKPIVNISGSPVVEVGRETVFICESQTKAEYKWNFSLPISRVRLEAANQILRYQDPRPEDDGKEITCIAMNDVGSGSMTLGLSVIELTSQMSYGPSQATGYVYNPNSKTRSLSFVTTVAGGCTMFLLVLLIMFAVCIHYHTNRDFRNTSLVAQPDVYFEPRDRVLQMSHGSCMRSVGVQVPRDIELEFVYHEIESRKSGSSCSAKNYSTGATSV